MTARMKKFLVLYKASASGFEQMKQSTPEQQKASMDGWMQWMGRAQAAIVDMGAPLGQAAQVSKDGTSTGVKNDLGGYGILKAESREALAKLLAGHPHFMSPGAFIEVTEILPVPGM